MPEQLPVENPALQRPPVADLVLRAAGRAVHPELWDALASRRVERANFTLTVFVTTGGHAIELTTPRGIVTEYLGPRDTDPLRGASEVERSLSSAQRAKAQFAAAHYEVSSRAEQLEAEQFAYVHAELARDGAARGFLVHAPPRERLGLAALSYVTADPVTDGLAVASFHTFPDEFVVVKTQSLLEFVT